MHVLVLGGSVFVGAALIESALARGWHVAAFNNDADWRAMPGVQHLRGDRTDHADLAQLRGRRWDLVFDTWAGPSEAVRRSATLLSGSAGAYVYISSLTVYQPQASRPLHETGAVLDRPPAGSTEPYAARKLAAERHVAEAFPAGNLIVRAGLLLGPRERPGRLPWWLDRLGRCGEVIAPAPRERAVQYADVRDLADWALRCAVNRRYGTYNFACPTGHATMGDVLEACQAAVGGTGRLHWIAQEELLRHGVRPWTGLPLWIPEPAGDLGLDVYNVDVTRAVRSGARFRPLAETVRDTQAWLVRVAAGAEPGPEQRPGRLTQAAEQAILARFQ